MAKKKNEELDFYDLFKILWTEKILIIFVTIFTSILTLLFYNSDLNPHKDTNKITQVVINDPDASDFYALSKFIIINSDANDNKTNDFKEWAQELRMEFIAEFYNRFTLPNNIQNFIEQNNEIGGFKDYLVKNKINVNKYFDRLIKKVNTDPRVKNGYSLIYNSDVLKGDKFLNDYVEFNKEETSKKIIMNIKDYYKNTIGVIDIKIELNNIKSNNITDETGSYTTLVLEKKKEILNQLLNNMNLKSFDYDPFLARAHEPRIAHNYKIFGTTTASILGMFLGFVFSLFIILIKNLIRK